MNVRVTSVTKTASFAPGEKVVIGRREDGTCQFGLDLYDTTISRYAVTLHFDGVWWIVNTSSHQRVRVATGQGEGETLAFLERRAVDREALTIVVYGRTRNHRVVVSVPRVETTEMPLPTPADPRPTVGETISLTEAERDALAALFHEYLEGRHDRDPRPEPYGEAAALLPRSVAATAVRRRFERVVERLRLAGVPGLEGDDLKRATAQFLIVNGMLTVDDLGRLSPTHQGRRDRYDGQPAPDRPRRRTHPRRERR